MCVRLPASYARSARKRYPVIYVLPGLAGSDTVAVTGNDDLGTVLDQLAVETRREAILVGVDTSSPFGSSYFTDSPLHGPWEQFGASTMVKAVDARYRTHATPQGRALAGHSTGGFDAVSLAMRHPEVFRAVAASAPDALDLDAWLWDAEGKLRKTWLGWMRTEDAMKGAGQLSSYAAAWSPDPATPGAFLWPADLASGAKQQPGEALWRKASPATWLETKDGLDRARKLSRRIVITCGKADEAGLFEPTERYVDALRKKGIDVTWLPTEDGHLGPKRPRFEPMLKFLLATMQPSR
jgi:S-formylglutathione hydrolase FrmB